MKKIIIINLLLVLIFNLFNFCFALESETETIKYKKDCKLYLKYKGQYKQVHYAFYEKDGKEYPAYCLTPKYSGVGVNGITEYKVNIGNKITNENLWRVIINGYPYKTLEELGVENKEEAYVATQTAIYTALENRKLSDYEADNSKEGQRTLKAYLKIMQNAKNSNDKITDKIELITNKEKWEIDDNEINTLSKVYSMKANALGTYKINLQSEDNKEIKITDIYGNEKDVFAVNEKFKILIPISVLKEEQDLNIEIISNLLSKPILYGKTTIEHTQDYALVGRENEEFKVNYKEELPLNNTKLKIIKQEVNSNNKIEGVKFKLLDDSYSCVFNNLITNKNGEIIIDNIVPGKYFLKEIETKSEYKLIDELIEINIILDEEKEIIVENELKTIQIKEDTEKISKLEEPEKIEEVIEAKTLPVTGF